MIANLDFPAGFVNPCGSIAVIMHEDNQVALNLATTQRITSSRTRHYHVRRWHFFWQSICDKMIDMMDVETKKWQADYCTKGLPA